MKRTVELDTLAICDRLNDLKLLSAAIAVRLDGVQRVYSREAIDGLTALAWRLRFTRTVSQREA